jgi:hypothetical protein
MKPGRPREEKGLRHFAVRICHKVEQKGETTYNEVADELVAELFQGASSGTVRDLASEEKNVRRRVYDALNVLCAIGVVGKDRRAVRWRGLPRASAREQSQLQSELSRLKSSVQDKDRRIQQYRGLVRALERLVQRNTRRSIAAAGGHARSSLGRDSSLRLPFLLIATEPDASVEIDGDDPSSGQCHFTFSRPFEIYDAEAVLSALESKGHPDNSGTVSIGSGTDLGSHSSPITNEAESSALGVGSTGNAYRDPYVSERDDQRAAHHGTATAADAGDDTEDI